MRAVILSVVGIVCASTAFAGSLEVQDAAFVPKKETKELGLPSFEEGVPTDALSFETIGQSGVVRMFDLGRSAPKPASGDVFQELQLHLSGAEQAAREPTKFSD